MYKNKTILGLIPARGGSKGLPKKNIKLLSGKPLITWTIEQALASKYLDKIVVSTDDEQIAGISRKYGAEVPFMRPKEMARDNSPTINAILDVLNRLEKSGQKFDFIVLLEPTSPLRETNDIDKCIELLLNNKSAKSIVSIAHLESSHPEFNVIIDKNTGFIKKRNGNTDFKVLRRQDLPDIYFFEGTVYISETENLKITKTFYHESTLAYVVPRWKSLEIDVLQDFICVEALFDARRKALF